MMNNSSEKFPLEYPIREMLKIYARRLLIFFAVVIVSLVLLGASLYISLLPESLKNILILIFIISFLMLFLKSIWKKHNYTEEALQESNRRLEETLAELKAAQQQIIQLRQRTTDAKE